MIRSLLLVLFITSSTALAAAASTPFNDGGVPQAYVNRETLRLERKLELTAPQTARVKAALEAVLSRTATQTLMQAMQEICTPAQFAVWKEEIKASSESYAAIRAAAETDQLAKTTNLSSEQRSKVKAAFYQIEFNDRMFQTASHTNAELEEHLYRVATDKENAMEKFMSPPQLEKRTQTAANGIRKPLPDIPALSLVADVPAGRYGWDSDAIKQ